MGNFVKDLRYALRTLRNNPAFTGVAVSALALGIGLNTSIFTLYDALALRPIPVKDPAQVIRLFRTAELFSDLCERPAAFRRTSRLARY